MKAIFVIGPALSGKTTYIINHYPHATVVNFSYFYKFAYAAQSNEEIEEIVANAQLYCRKELQDRLVNAKEDDVFVLEHSMLTQKERAFYINVIREASDVPIDVFVMDPDIDALNIMLKSEKQLIALYEYEKLSMDPVSIDEGFASVTHIANPMA